MSNQASTDFKEVAWVAFKRMRHHLEQAGVITADDGFEYALAIMESLVCGNTDTVEPSVLGENNGAASDEAALQHELELLLLTFDGDVDKDTDRIKYNKYGGNWSYANHRKPYGQGLDHWCIIVMFINVDTYARVEFEIKFTGTVPSPAFMLIRKK